MKDTGVYLNHGIAILAGVLIESGHSAELLIVDTKSYNKQLYVERCRQADYDIAAISVYTNQWHFVKEIARNIKKARKVPIVCGGPHSTLFAESLAETQHIDALVAGEGEIAFREFIARTAGKMNLKNIAGLYFKDENGNIAGSGMAARCEDINELPFPQYSIYGQDVIENYTGIMFSRGCPFECSYCCNSAYRKLYGNNHPIVRFLSPSRAIAMAKAYKDKMKVKQFSIDDDTFTKNTKWLYEFLPLYKNEIGLPFNCNARPETITKETVKILKDSGCGIVSIGVESGDEGIRKNMLNRMMKNDVIEKAAEIIHEGGLKLSTFNMIGMPGESLKNFIKTIEINRRLMPDYTQISVYYPFKGTKLGDCCYNNGLVRRHLVSGSYFAKSILKNTGMSALELLLGQRLFKFFVYSKKSFPMAVWALLKDIIKSLPFSYNLIGPYLKTKRFMMRPK